MKRRSRFLCLGGLILSLFLGIGNARGAQLGISGSLRYARGNYFLNTNTNSYYLLGNIWVKSRVLQFTLSLPLVVQNNKLLASGLMGPLPSEHAPGRDFMMGHHPGRDTSVESMETVWGLGDIYFKGEAFLKEDYNLGLILSLYGQLKFPTSNELGTGKWDYALGLSLGKTLLGGSTFLNVAYYVFGDTPAYDFKNTLGYSIGFSRLFSNPKFGWMIFFTGSSSFLDGYDPHRELDFGINYNLSRNLYLNFGLGFGMTDTSPDFLLFIGVSKSLSPYRF